MKSARGVLMLAFAMALWVTGPAAQNDDYDMADVDADAATKDDFIKALTPPPPLRSRSLDGSPPPPPKLRAVPLRIRFELNSHQLTEEAKETLNHLGSALISEALVHHRFRIEGHTDASGGEDYNRDLSKRRADGVKNYLVSIFEMDPDRLESIGRGEGSLINPDEPESADNRVVLIVNLGPPES